MFEHVKLLRKRLNLTQAEFGEKIHRSRDTIRLWETGKIMPDAGTVQLIAKTFNVSEEWLSTGVGELYFDVNEPEIIKLPIYDIYASAGYGAWVNGESICGYMDMPVEVVKRMMGSKPKYTSLLYVKGNSMNPTLNDGDLIAIDTSKTDMQKGLYVVRVGNDLYVKNVIFSYNNATLVSNNSNYEPMVVEYDDAFALIGRVVWFGRSI